MVNRSLVQLWTGRWHEWWLDLWLYARLLRWRCTKTRTSENEVTKRNWVHFIVHLIVHFLQKHAILGVLNHDQAPRLEVRLEQPCMLGRIPVKDSEGTCANWNTKQFQFEWIRFGILQILWISSKRGIGIGNIAPWNPFSIRIFPNLDVLLQRQRHHWRKQRP